jgi:hypothetical protein
MEDKMSILETSRHFDFDWERGFQKILSGNLFRPLRANYIRAN